MQLRWIAIGVVCFSAALLSACGSAAGNTSARSAAVMSKSTATYNTSDKDNDSQDKDDDCDESDDSDKSSNSDKSSDSDKSGSKSKSLSMMSSKSSKSDDDKPECKDDDNHGKSSGSHDSSKSLSMSKSNSRDDGKGHGKDDDDTCKVTICHIPPGNHCKPHKIRVGKSAELAHIEHGDYLGACDPGPVTPPPPAKNPPVAKAKGPAHIASASVAVTLDGSLSADPADPNAQLNYQWSVLAGSVTLANDTTVAPTFAAPAVAFDQAPVTLTFQLIVNDTNGTSTPTSVDVIVDPEPAPVTPPTPPAGPTCDPAACPGDPNGNGVPTCDTATNLCTLQCIPPTVLVPGSGCLFLGG
jgi:hypothetical protein